MSTPTSSSSPRWVRALREKKYIVAGALLSILFTFVLVANSGADSLLAFSRTHAKVDAYTGELSVPVAASQVEGESDGLEEILGPQTPSPEEGFTLVVPTYKRMERLPKFLENYADGKIQSLRRIVLLWNDIENEPPEDFLRSLSKFKVPVIVEQRHINSLNQRFRKSENIKTECVLSLDDDMLFKPEDIQLGYAAWKQYGQGRRRMLGYVARETTDDNDYMVRDFDSYSMVLTKCAFFHVDWMGAYWSEDRVMTGLRDYVEEHNNCEDILMAFIHAHYTKVPPMFYDAPFTDMGLTKGISTEPGHLKARTECVRHFVKELGKDTLVSSDLKLSRMKKNG